MRSTRTPPPGAYRPAPPSRPRPDDTADAVAAIVRHHPRIRSCQSSRADTRIRPYAASSPAGGSHEETPPLTPMQAHMRCACDRDAAAFSMRSQEIAYLANTILVGCSIQSRPPSPQQASDAAVAVCNLGLENWPHRWLTGQARRGSAEARCRPCSPGRFSDRARPRQRVPGWLDCSLRRTSACTPRND